MLGKSSVEVKRGRAALIIKENIDNVNISNHMATETLRVINLVDLKSVSNQAAYSMTCRFKNVEITSIL